MQDIHTPRDRARSDLPPIVSDVLHPEIGSPVAPLPNLAYRCAVRDVFSDAS